ncbi:amino acid adenylation domain-containing protein [Streptomyces lydicus]|uniref:amino acid adenylation domain-containing protein n=1 Tax=Streptomyces lydicus TaxID=47763 RepID=UPI00378C281A
MAEDNQHDAASSKEPGGFHRPVSPIEWWFAGHPDAQSATIQFLVEGVGHIAPQVLATAVEAASAACPGARLVRDGLTWVDSGTAPAVRVVEARGTDPADVLRLPELQTPLAGPQAPTCEVVLVQGPVTTVSFRATHAVMDARGLMTWALDVFRVLRGKEPVGAPDPISGADVLADMSDVEELSLPAHNRASVLGPFDSSDRTRSLSGRRSVQGNHPGVVAKLATALVTAAGLETGLFFVPVDLRHVRPDARTTANMSHGVHLEVTAGEDWEEVHERLLRAVADGEATQKAPPASLLTRTLAELNEAVTVLDDKTRREGLFPTNAVVAHAGRVALADLHTPEFTAHTAYALSRPVPAGAPDVSVLEVDGRTEITLSWWEASDMAARIDALLDGLVEELSPAEHRHWIGNDTAARLPSEASVVDLFARQVAATPDAVALDGPEGEMTYAEFAERTAVVASELRARGAGRETVVGVLADRSVSAMIAIWGVLRAGAAYLPLDAHLPNARILDVLTDVGAPLCLVQRPHDERDCLPEGCAPLVIEALDYSMDPPALDSQIQPNDLAYVIYTSGSTGRPKGVQIEHGGLTNYVQWAVRDFRIDADSRVPLLSSLSFDVSVNTILLPLLVGGTAVLRLGAVSHTLLRELLVRSPANALFLTPSHLDLINRLGLAPEGFRSVVVIGEQLRRSVAQRSQEVFGANCEIINSYGPTEATVVLTQHVYAPDTDTGPSVPVGAPTDNSTVFILDSQSRFATVGERGEMYLGGVQLARGYRGRPDLDRERFVRLADGTPVYRTGDIARALPNGELEFIGRSDDQVKVLGHRIEPAEIAQALESHPGVEAAVVVPRPRPGQEHKALCAYVIAAEVTAAELNEHVAQLLPSYMVPSMTELVESIPYTINGKVDIRSLPDPFLRDRQTTDVSDRDELTVSVTDIWSHTLGLPTDEIADTSDFYQLGGNSLLLLSMLAAVSMKVVGGAGEAQFMGALGQIIREPTLNKVTELARRSAPDSARTPGSTERPGVD